MNPFLGFKKFGFSMVDFKAKAVSTPLRNLVYFKLIVLIFLSSLWALPSQPNPAGPKPAQNQLGHPSPKKVIVIPVEEEVDFGLHAFLKRSVAQALEKKPDVIIFKINTYGGELQSAFEIVDLLTGIVQCSTYAYVEQKAISAGALISLSWEIAPPSATALLLPKVKMA
jgi:membrane-bound ClpP family serine protease